MDSERSDANRKIFVRVVSAKVRPFVEEEILAMHGAYHIEERTRFVSEVVDRLLARFHELGEKEASAYMPLIMMAVKKADANGV